MITMLPAERLDEVRALRIALHRHHSAIDVPAGWVSRDENEAWDSWRQRASAVLASGGVLFVHASEQDFDGLALVGMLDAAELVRPVLEASGPHAELFTMVVAGGVRGGGVGGRLYAAAAGWAREQGAVAMHVDTRADNVDGLRFYQRQGARPAFTQLMQPL